MNKNTGIELKLSYCTSFCRIVSHISNVVGQSDSNNKWLVTLSANLNQMHKLCKVVKL